MSTAPFQELASDPTAMSLAEMGPTKVFGAEKGSKLSTGGVSRRKSTEWASMRAVAERYQWGRKEGGPSPSKSMLGMEGAQYAPCR